MSNAKPLTAEELRSLAAYHATAADRIDRPAQYVERGRLLVAIDALRAELTMARAQNWLLSERDEARAAKAEADIARLTADVNRTAQTLAETEDELEKAEAECAAMRHGLSAALPGLRHGANRGTGGRMCAPEYCYLCDAKRALSTSAGAALLAEVEALGKLESHVRGGTAYTHETQQILAELDALRTKETKP